MKNSIDKALMVELRQNRTKYQVRKDWLRELQQLDQGIEERKAEVAKCDSWMTDIILFSPDGADDVLCLTFCGYDTWH